MSKSVKRYYNALMTKLAEESSLGGTSNADLVRWATGLRRMPRERR